MGGSDPPIFPARFPTFSSESPMNYDINVADTSGVTKLVDRYAELHRLNLAEVMRLYISLDYDEELTVRERLDEEMKNIKAAREIATMPVLTSDDFAKIKAEFGYRENPQC